MIKACETIIKDMYNHIIAKFYIKNGMNTSFLVLSDIGYRTIGIQEKSEVFITFRMSKCNFICRLEWMIL